jgi:Rrf2 family protein
MRITTQGDYALRCMIHIAANGTKKPVCISRIAQEEKLPLDYIEQLLMKLRRKRLIKSVRGVNGGYLLNREASRITVKDVIEAVEGEAFEIICGRMQNAKKHKCASPGRCRLKKIWKDLKGQIEGYLDKQTLASLLRRT